MSKDTEMDTKNLLNKIIPPADYQHRNGFSNTQFIDKLSDQEKNEVEDSLITLLKEGTNDTLIAETLSYLKSTKSLPLLYKFLEQCSDAMAKIIVATSIFEINNDINMIDAAIVSFEELDNNKDAYYIYKVISAFYYLVKFRNSQINIIIENYTHHEEYLVSYNAKQALGNH